MVTQKARLVAPCSRAAYFDKRAVMRRGHQTMTRNDERNSSSLFGDNGLALKYGLPLSASSAATFPTRDRRLRRETRRKEFRAVTGILPSFFHLFLPSKIGPLATLPGDNENAISNINYSFRTQMHVNPFADG